jgi:endonuclease G
MVSTKLMLTNNHVLGSIQMSKRSLLDFNFEDDIDFMPKNMKTFSLDPDSFFYTDQDLDFSLVAVKSTSSDGTPLSTFDHLKLIEEPGKAVVGETVTIIQHPRGGTKSVTLRDNLIVDLLDHFIHYQTDTERGSSGGPIFNDQWQVVGLHHAGVKKKDENGNVLTVDGEIWTPDMSEEKIAWKANEGVRISSIINDLNSRLDDFSSDKKKILNQLLVESKAGQVLESPEAAMIGEMEVVELVASDYNGDGYDQDFLEQQVPLPTLSSALVGDIAPLNDGTGNVLNYNHFSIVSSKKRRLAFFTAVNIEGSKLQRIERTADRWYFDPRIDRKFQSGLELYRNNPLDRGHLVRRLDPVWGEVAVQANEDTFHFTNCSPQHENLNQQTWVDLEDYILNNAETYGMKVSVFTGPVFRDDDMVYRVEFQIPAEYWKVVIIYMKNRERLSATAYLQTQKNLIEDLEFAFGPYRTYQIPITKIESLTRLDFGNLREHDPIADLEATSGRLITGADDIIL